MNKPRVTLVIPVYKGKKYMKEAIDSALAQTYENLEILVINDGSPDDGATDKIARSYGDKIKYILKENGGVSSVLNLAIKEMSGEYFSWLSQDDVYCPNKVEEDIKYLMENKLLGKKVILYSDYELINKNSKIISQGIKDHKMLEEKPEYALLRGAVNGITMLIPKKAFEECGEFDEKLSCAQDYDMWYRMMQKGYKFVHIPKVLAKTRLHSNQDTNTNPKVVVEGNNFWINMIEDIPTKTKIKLEGSEYSYYYEMAEFLKSTTYKIAEKHCRDKYLELENKIKETIKDTKVSVIIPFYNRIPLVIRAVTSVLNQTHKNYEVLLVNDGSVDDMSELKELVKKHKNIKLINVKPNKGASNARNVGMDNAKGDFVAFLDSDDAFEPKKLEVQLLKMILTNSKVSHTSYNRDINGNVSYINSGVKSGNMIPKLICSCQIATPTVMIERKYLEDNKFRFDSNLVIGEDTCFWLTILIKEKLLGIDEPLTTVYANETSAAYNNDKQVIGMKTILTFALNHPELKKYDYEIGMVASYYINFINKANKKRKISSAAPMYSNCSNCDAIMNSFSWKITKPLRWAKKVLRSLKNEGVIETTKKILRAVKNKLKKN